MAEDRSPHKTTPSGSSDLPLTRSLFAVFVAAIGSSSVGYALGYPSSALLDLAGLPGDRAFTRGSTASQLFGVSKDMKMGEYVSTQRWLLTLGAHAQRGLQ